MTESKGTIAFEKEAHAGWVYFNRPERMNALAAESVRELWVLLGRIEADTQIRAAVFTGRGEAFCAGMDMAGMENSSPLVARRRSREMQMLSNRIAELSLPTIAAVNGVAMGAGLEICLACDLVIASTAARFAFPEVRLGMIPCGGGTQRLARLVGLRKAREMILTGKVLDAEQALAWGLVNEVVTPLGLVAKVDELTEKLIQGGRFALFQAKRCLNHALDMDINRGLEYETECFTTCFSTGEPSAGLKRFAAGAGEARRSTPPAEKESQGQSAAEAPPAAAPTPQPAGPAAPEVETVSKHIEPAEQPRPRDVDTVSRDVEPAAEPQPRDEEAVPEDVEPQPQEAEASTREVEPAPQAAAPQPEETEPAPRAVEHHYEDTQPVQEAREETLEKEEEKDIWE